MGAIITLNWSPPENHKQTAIEYYELTLIGTHTNSTKTVHTGTDSQQTFSHKQVVSEGNYTAASITAVDVCGQRSEPSYFVLNAIVGSTTTPNPFITARFLGGTIGTGMALLLIILLCLVIVIVQCKMLYGRS